MGWFKWPKLTRGKLVSSDAESRNYKRHVASPGALFHYEDRPFFSLLTAELMQFDPKVTQGLAIRNGLLAQLEVDVIGGPPAIREYISRQWERIWSLSGPILMESKNVGWVGWEAMFRPGDQGSPDAGKAIYSGHRDFHPRDTRPLVQSGKIVGCTVNGCQADDGNKLALFAPKGIYVTFRDRYSSYYGTSLLEHAYPPWYEKWQRGGAIKLRQLRMMKDAWIGDFVRYPTNKKTTLPDGTVVSWRDVAREMVQLRQSGGIIGLPSDGNGDGKYAWDYQPPTSIDGASPIFDYKKDLDGEIFEGLEISREIVEMEDASGLGSAGGRIIPLIALLASLQREGEDYIGQIDRMLLRPLVRWEFNCEPSYQIKAKPLIETFQKLMKAGEQKSESEPQSNGLKVFSGFGKPPAGPQAGDSNGSAAGYRAQQFSATTPRARTCSWRDRTSPRKARLLYGSTVGGVYYRPGEWISPAALAYASDDELLQLSDSGDGSRWITIGGRSIGEDKHVGGFPIKIDRDGNIIAGGPRGMRGLHVSKSGEYFAEQKRARAKSGEDKFAGVSDFFDSIKAENDAAAAEGDRQAKADYEKRGPGNTRSLKAIVSYQAEKWGMEEETYKQFMDDAWKETLAFNQEREDFKRHAREVTGLDAGKIKRIEESGGVRGKGGDSDSVKNLDTSAEALANEYPQFLNGKGDAAEQLFEMLKEGAAQPLSRTSREFHDRIDEMLEEAMGKAGEQYTEEEAAAAVGAYADEYLGFSAA